MNIHVPEEIQKKWPGYSFIGKPFFLKDGKKYIRAYSKTFEKTHFYDFAFDWFWHEEPPKVNILSPLTQSKNLL